MSGRPDSFKTCLICREPVGVRDPIVVIEHDGERETSLAGEPDVAERTRGLLAHARCAQSAQLSRD